MAFIDHILQEPSYGWTTPEGTLKVPTKGQLWKEAFSRINIFRCKKNWISLMSWLMVLCMVPFLYLFIFHHFSWLLLIVLIAYSLIYMGTHGTIWFHRFCTHRAYKFSNPAWRVITQNLAIKTFPEEIYVVSHHVHHAKSDMPGDPYNPGGGFLYCMLSDVNHQSINKNLDERDYTKASRLMQHTGIVSNSYTQYKRWGSITHPGYATLLWLLNWGFWFAILYMIGGMAMVSAIFTAAMMWFILVRAFNYTGHGKGEAKHIDGIDFDRSNLSINQTRPGLFTGEWHNNHHLYPGSARAGFLPYQLDLAWIYIFCMHKIGIVSSYHDSKKEFMRKYQENRKNQL
ncbi:fatty acid desaturase [Gynurincola endophyticus]|uniref:fatty acid desaturase n=1 Tax=Gynurincola endophyticus TaxID=2479004 RepID=UPI000F8E3304|nr:fatty acid desaturase [Gynurincola endophyticus]